MNVHHANKSTRNNKLHVLNTDHRTKVKKDGHTGARTQDHSVISTALYRLSYTTSILTLHLTPKWNLQKPKTTNTVSCTVKKGPSTTTSSPHSIATRLHVLVRQTQATLTPNAPTRASTLAACTLSREHITHHHVEPQRPMATLTQYYGAAEPLPI